MFTDAKMAGGKRVFLVDDEEPLRVALADVLVEHGFEVTAFPSGEDALSALRDVDVDVLLTDLVMPGMDGIALIRKALHVDPRLVCVVLTGQASVDSAVEAMRQGAFDFIEKPFRTSILLPTLARALEVRRLRRENVELRESQSVYELTTAIAFTLDPRELREKLIDAALQQCAVDEASLLVPTATGDELEVVVVRGPDKARILGQRVAVGAGIAGWVARAGEAVTLVGEVRDPRFKPLFPRADIVAAMSVPLVAAGKLVGVLNVNRTHGHRSFTPGEAKSLSMLASLAASALETARAYETTQAAEDRFHSLFDNVLEGLFRARDDGEIILANRAYANMMGFESAEELFQAQQTAGVGLLPTGVEKMVDAVKRQDDALSFEVRVRRKDGTKAWHSIHLRTIRAPDGTVLHFDGGATDVTDRKRAYEEACQRSEQLQALRKIDMAITASLDLRVTLDVFLAQVMSQLAPDAADVMLFDAHSQMLECVASVGFRNGTDPCTHLRSGQGLAGTVVQERKMRFIPVLDEDPHACPERPCVRDEGFVSACSVPLLAKGHVLGVLQLFFRKRFESDAAWLKFLEALAGQAAIALDNAALFSDLDRANADLVTAYETTIEGWSRALDLRDRETEGHSLRVTDLTIALARKLGMASADLAHVRRGALLHDLGKMGIPDSILLKPGPLTPEERTTMETHARLAYTLLSPIPFLRQSIDIPYNHHEKWDGSGYPRGLKGEEIPMAARIFAIVDVWDALTNDRPYRKAMARDEALGILRAGAGSHFEPRVVEAFLETLDEKPMAGKNA